MAKNLPSGAANGLTVALYDTKSNRLCYDSAGNVTSDERFGVSCTTRRSR